MKWLRERHTVPSAYDNAKTMVDFYKRFLSVSKIPVPTIAAINGSAIGAGLCMTLACDFRIASEKAKLGFTFTKLGIHPGMGCSTLLPRLINQQYATYLLLSGKLFDTKIGVEKGLLLEHVKPELFKARSMELAEELGVVSPIAVQSCVHSLRNQKFDGLFDTLLWNEAYAQAVAFSSKDYIRGLDAVVTKSAPEFTGE